MSKRFILILLLAGCAAFRPAPAAQDKDLLGPSTRAQILAAVPEWEGIAAAYQPKPGPLDSLKALGRPILIEVYFGSWCSDSKAHVSAFFKILDLVDNPLLQVSYTAIPRDKSARAKYLPANRGVGKLPTFIVYSGPEEIGRITENPAKTMEEDLALILRK